MHNVNQTYRDIIATGDYETETKLVIAGVDFGEDKIISARIKRSLFSGNTPTVGGCVSGELTCTLLARSSDIPKMAEIRPFVRVKARTRSDGRFSAIAGVAVAGLAVVGTGMTVEDKTSDWLQKGVFYCDTRDIDINLGTVTIHAYDLIMAMEGAYPADRALTDWRAVVLITNTIGLTIDPETVLGYEYVVPEPAGAISMRSVMQNIAAAYAGNWQITDEGKLRLIRLNSLPPETFYLTLENGDAVTFGGDRIVLS